MLFSQLIENLKNGNAGLKDQSNFNDPEITSCASVDKAIKNQITFLEDGNKLSKELYQTQASAILLPDKDKLVKEANSIGIDYAVLANPRLGFAEILNALHPRKKYNYGIHPSAAINKGVKLGDNVYIAENVSIGENSIIGDNVAIHPGVVIYADVIIERDCELHANCVIHYGSKLGESCIIQPNVVIGSEGFGFVPTTTGWFKMPQTGIVIIERDVEIGSGSTVDRPAVGETRIGAGTKIDNLVQIGHGVTIGRNCAMASQVGIAGGAKIGNGVILAGQVGVGNRVEVGDRVIASSKCGIHANVEKDSIVSGFPAMPNKLWLRCSATFRKLPELAKTIRDLNRTPNL